MIIHNVVPLDSSAQPLMGRYNVQLAFDRNLVSSDAQDLDPILRWKKLYTISVINRFFNRCHLLWRQFIYGLFSFGHVGLFLAKLRYTAMYSRS